MFTVQQENATKFDSKNDILQIFLYHWVASYGYIIVDLCIISFNLNCIMQLKQFYNIATKVSSRKKVLLLLVIYLTDNVSGCDNFIRCCEVSFLLKDTTKRYLNAYIA